VWSLQRPAACQAEAANLPPGDAAGALLAAIERDYAELQRIPNNWVVSRVPTPGAPARSRKVGQISESEEAPLPQHVDVAEVLGIPNPLLGAMLAGKCRDQHILVTKERQRRFAEFVLSNCSGNSFSMSDCNVGPECAKAVAMTLALCTQYTELNLSRNSLGDQGAHVIASLLMKNSGLTAVDVSANDISCRGVNFILTAMLVNCHVQSLDLSSKTASLRNRLAQQSAGVLEDDLLTKNSTLLHLNLASTNLGFGGAQGLARGLVGNHTLQSLDISQNDIGDRGGTCVAAALKDCGLLDLNLADNRIGDEGFLNLGACLGALPRETQSSVWSRALDPQKAAAKYVDSVHFLRRLVLEVEEKELHVVPHGSDLTHLQSIQEAADALHMAVRGAEVTLPKLTSLTLSNNSATAIGVRGLADALHVNCMLEKVCMDHCEHRDADHGVHSLVTSLPANTTLRHLSLSCAVLGPAGLVNLAKVMAANKALRVLNLSGNIFDSVSAQAWAVTLGGNTALKQLCLSACHLNDAAGQVLAEGLAENEGLQQLSLRDNALRDQAAAALEEALLHNGTLIQLNLELNSIDFRSLAKIKQLLERNSKIRDKGLPDKYRSRIGDLSQCKREVERMTKVLSRNHQKKRIALWKQAAKVQKLKDEKEEDRQRQEQVEEQLQELLQTQEQMDQ
ncbi:unnamed protein product, partial [Effrenium voratum]